MELNRAEPGSHRRSTLVMRGVYLNPQPAPQQFTIKVFRRRIGQSTRIGVVDPVVGVELDSDGHADVGQVRLSFDYDVIWYAELHL